MTAARMWALASICAFSGACIGYPGSTEIKVEGTVVDEAGRPVPGALVTVVASDDRYVKRLLAHSSSKSTSDGRFTVEFSHPTRNLLRLEETGIRRYGPSLTCGACTQGTFVSYFRCDQPPKQIVLINFRSKEELRAMDSTTRSSFGRGWLSNSANLKLDMFLSECKLRKKV